MELQTPAGSWTLYVLECGDGTLYCGITNDLERRFKQHQSGKAARYTRGRGPLRVLKTWSHADKGEALRAEIAFKKLTLVAKRRQLAS